MSIPIKCCKRTINRAYADVCIKARGFELGASIGDIGPYRRGVFMKIIEKLVDMKE